MPIKLYYKSRQWPTLAASIPAQVRHLVPSKTQNKNISDYLQRTEKRIFIFSGAGDSERKWVKGPYKEPGHTFNL